MVPPCRKPAMLEGWISESFIKWQLAKRDFSCYPRRMTEDQSCQATQTLSAFFLLSVFINICFQYMMITFFVGGSYRYTSQFSFYSFLPSSLHLLITFSFKKDLSPYFGMSIFYFSLYSYKKNYATHIKVHPFSYDDSSLSFFKIE